MLYGMQQILFIIAIALVIFAVYAFYKSSQKAKEERGAADRQRQDPFAGAQGAENFGPEILGPGAVLSRGGVDYVVRGSLAISEGPFTWYEHMLDGGKGTEWLSVQVDEGQLELVMWETRKGTRIDQTPTVTVDGVTYYEQERGEARYTTEGNTGLPPQGQVHYIDYEGPGEQRLGQERFDGAGWEFSVGRVVGAGEFTVYPAPKA